MEDWNQQHPFSKGLHSFFKGMNPLGMQKYMEEMMANTIPKNFTPYQQGGTEERNKENENIEVLETHDFIFVRVHITTSNEADQTIVKVFYTPSLAMIRNYPKEGEELKINLPSTVRRKGGKASYKNGVLELRMIKDSDVQLTEIDVQL
ncbi:hypothetical protein Q75_07190 [Bacillus coahuilensis p1.1.43]|uniref:Uncharacterized protein n=1 Tax=Bacillus coahuilensis p1.1.43 TaxID=1150625 RepID=A0A147K9B3_9BACI|nr:hypothetical protein [Bacillus coahuilensis]KUP06857.1 hypothetical protein Q75_07190 [Bacillus coahuilensis p1.1.43]